MMNLIPRVVRHRRWFILVPLTRSCRVPRCCPTEAVILMVLMPPVRSMDSCCLIGKEPDRFPRGIMPERGQKTTAELPSATVTLRRKDTGRPFVPAICLQRSESRINDGRRTSKRDDVDYKTSGTSRREGGNPLRSGCPNFNQRRSPTLICWDFSVPPSNTRKNVTLDEDKSVKI